MRLGLTVSAMVAAALAGASAAFAQGPALRGEQVASLTEASPALHLPPMSIRFKDEAVVDGGTVRLGDIARVIAGREKAVAEIETLEVAKSAGFGLTRLIDTDYLFTRYLQRYSDRFAIDYDKKCVRVTTRCGKLPNDSLAALVDAFLAAQPKRAGEVRRWEIARAPEQILVPAGPYRLELAYAGMKRKGKVDLNLSIRDSVRVLRNIPVTLNVRVDEPVLVAKQQIARGEALTPANSAVEMRETTQMNDFAVMDPKKLMGNLSRISLTPGRIITPVMVAVPPTVKRGQEAKIVYHNGAVSVTAGAVCRQDGVPGQIISVKSLASQRLVRVRVAEDGTLEPVPGG